MRVRKRLVTAAWKLRKLAKTYVPTGKLQERRQKLAGIFWYFPCKAVIRIRWCQSTDKDKGHVPVAAHGMADGVHSNSRALGLARLVESN